MRKSLTGMAVTAILAGCGGERTPPAPAPAEAGTAAVASPDGTFELLLPARWTGVYRIDSLSTPEQGTARPGALNLVYLPSDTVIRPQTLVVVAVYDSAAWAVVRATEGPPPGDSVAARAGRVYVVGLPQSNPFAPGSPDAVRFDSLQLRPAEVATLVRIR